MLSVSVIVFLKYLTSNSDDLELGLFKVIQGKSPWCQMEAHWWFPIWLPLCPTLYLSQYSRYLMWKLWSGTVQGHARSKVMVPIDSTWVTSYSTSTDAIIVSVTILKYLMCNSNDRELRQFKVIKGQKSWCRSIAHGWLPIWLLLSPTSYLSSFLKYFTCNFNDLELGQFNVIQGQKS